MQQKLPKEFLAEPYLVRYERFKRLNPTTNIKLRRDPRLNDLLGASPWGISGPEGHRRWPGGHILAFVFLSIVTARGGQTGADHFSSKPRLVLPTVPQIGRGGRRNAFKLQIWAIGVPLTRYRQTLAPNRQKFADIGSTEPRLPINVV